MKGGEGAPAAALEHDDRAQHSTGEGQEGPPEIIDDDDGLVGGGASSGVSITAASLVTSEAAAPPDPADDKNDGNKAKEDQGRSPWMMIAAAERTMASSWPPAIISPSVAMLIMLLLLVVVVASGLGWYYIFAPADHLMTTMRRRSSPVAAAVDMISQHGAWQKMETGIQRCIPSNDTEDGDIKSLFDDASAAHADDMSHDMNRYLYLAIMHAFVLGSRFTDDPATSLVPGQKVGKVQVERYLRVMLDTMQGLEITTSHDASAEFNQMNRYLYLTIVQASVLRNKYPTNTYPPPPPPSPSPSPPPPQPSPSQLPPPPLPASPEGDEIKRQLHEKDEEIARLRDKDEETTRRLRGKEEEITRIREKNEETARQLRDKEDEIKRLRDEVYKLQLGLKKCEDDCEHRVADCHSHYMQQRLSYHEDY